MVLPQTGHFKRLISQIRASFAAQLSWIESKKINGQIHDEYRIGRSYQFWTYFSYVYLLQEELRKSQSTR